MIGKNIFIDFSIIKKSNKSLLVDELDKLISLKNNIYIWSKTVPVKEMNDYCLNVDVELDIKNKHKKIIELRDLKKSFKEISKETDTPIEQISFFLTTDPEKTWTLNDWIKSYFIKDASIYGKADFIIDPDERFVNRFKSKGLDGNYIEKI